MNKQIFNGQRYKNINYKPGIFSIGWRELIFEQQQKGKSNICINSHSLIIFFWLFFSARSLPFLIASHLGPFVLHVFLIEMNLLAIYYAHFVVCHSSRICILFFIIILFPWFPGHGIQFNFRLIFKMAGLLSFSLSTDLNPVSYRTHISLAIIDCVLLLFYIYQFWFLCLSSRVEW